MGVDVQVVEGDEHGPSGLASFAEQFPSDDEEEEGNHPDHAEVGADEGVNEGRILQVHEVEKVDVRCHKSSMREPKPQGRQ